MNMRPSEAAARLRQIADTIDKSKRPRPDLVIEDINIVIAAVDPILAKGKNKKKPKSQKRGDCVFPHTSPKVKDKKDHFPINSEKQAKSALSYANGFEKSPPWYDGSLKELVSAVARKVKSKYPNMEVSEESKKPGAKKKGKKKKASMKPSEVAGLLNRIATGIDNSKRPQQHLVIEDLQRIIDILENE
jgi:hypothetical protein